jgi:hypothetical protein
MNTTNLALQAAAVFVSLLTLSQSPPRLNFFVNFHPALAAKQ